MNNKLSAILIALSICLLCLSNDYRFAHLTSANGISQSEIYAFLEDHNGFMWIGTLDGLSRYDGYTFTIFNSEKKNTNTLSHNTIRSLTEDRYGRIWIGTDDGLNCYDQRKELISRIKTNTSKENLIVWSSLIYNDYLYIGTNDGLWRCSLTSNNLEDIEKSLQKIPKFCSRTITNTDIRSMVISKSGGFWVLSNHSLSKISFRETNTEAIILDDLTNGQMWGLIDLKEDSMGCLWVVCYDNSIFKYNPQRKDYQNITQNNRLLNNFSKKYWNISIDHNQKIWVGTDDQGLLCIHYDFENEKIKNIEKIQKETGNSVGLNSNLIFSTYVSGTNKLWIGTIGSGVNILDPEINKIAHYKIESTKEELSSSNFVRAVMVDKQNRIIIGIQKNGLFVIDREKKQTRKLGFETQTIFHISQYRDNQYFICSNNGLFLVEINGSVFKILKHCEDFNFAAFYIVHSQQDIYWCATLEGLYRIKVNNQTMSAERKYNNQSHPSLSKNNCRVLYFDESNKQLLVGTEGGGLNILQLDPDGFPVDNIIYKTAETHNSLSNNYVRTIFIDRDHNIWVGTYEGLNKILIDPKSRQRTFKTFTKKDGLPNSMIQFIDDDKQGNLWLGTNGGLSKFAPDNETFINYFMDDGLQSNEFSEHTVYKTDSGELLMGGINGINAFFPEDIKNSKLKPRTIITDFYLNNQEIRSGQVVGTKIPLTNSILYTNKIELSSENKNIGFKFSAMIYPNSGKIKYAYMLEGFDKDWKYTDALNRNINYTNLKHGNYIFKVKATNTDGVWEQNPKSLSLNIKTPFFLTWYAMILYLVIFILLLLYFTNYTVIGLTTKRNLILEKLHNEKLHKLDELRTNFFINISHDLRTPLTLISEPLNDVLTDNSVPGNIKDKLILAKRNVKRLTFLVEQLLDIRKAEMNLLTPKLQTDNLIGFTRNELAHFSYTLNKKGLELKLEYNEDPLWVSFDPAMLSKVYFNIVSNAIKYTTAGQIIIKIEKVQIDSSKNKKDPYIKVEIRDTGIGIKKEQEKLIFERFYQDSRNKKNGYGIGLSHTKDIVEAHKGFIEAEGSDNAGTAIRFFIPDIMLSNINADQDKYSTENLYNNEASEDENEITEAEDTQCQSVLIVEDNPDMLNYIKARLQKHYNVILAKDGEEGLTIAKEKMPDLIISDLMMPIMDGIEFCREIKTNINTSHIPVILLTAKADLKTKYEGIETGADDFIAKPFEMKYLLIRIKNLLQSRENLRKLIQQNKVVEPSEVTVTLVDNKFLSTVIDAIEDRISDENFSIGSLESQLGMSHTSFYRKIKTLTGQSAQEFLLTYRMKKAFQIFSENKSIRVSEVAFRVGFSSPKYFTKCFKDMYGYVPSEIKHEH